MYKGRTRGLQRRHLYNMMKIGAVGILFRNNAEVLLCHRRDCDVWTLPGGGVEDGETPWIGAIREFKEETGFEVGVKRLVGIYFKPEKNEIVFSFLCVLQGGVVTPNDEADQIEFFSCERIPPNTSPKQVERIHDALQILRGEQTQV